jgi:hypothetical protein
MMKTIKDLEGISSLAGITSNGDSVKSGTVKTKRRYREFVCDMSELFMEYLGCGEPGTPPMQLMACKVFETIHENVCQFQL